MVIAYALSSLAMIPGSLITFVLWFATAYETTEGFWNYDNLIVEKAARVVERLIDVIEHLTKSW